MTIQTGDVIRLVLTFDAPEATIAQNVWHMVGISGAGATPAVVLAGVETQMQVVWAAIGARASSQWSASLLEILQYDFTLHRWDGVGFKAVSGIAGTGGTDFAPHGIAAICQIGTGAQRRQGRTFFPGVTEDSITGGLLTVAAVAAFLAAGAYFDTDISVSGCGLSWCTFNTDPTSPLYETSSIATQAVSVSDIPGYQRRRKPGVGA